MNEREEKVVIILITYNLLIITEIKITMHCLKTKTSENIRVLKLFHTIK